MSRSFVAIHAAKEREAALVSAYDRRLLFDSLISNVLQVRSVFFRHFKIFTRSTQKRGYEKQSTINSEFLILNSELKYRRMEGANIVWQA